MSADFPINFKLTATDNATPAMQSLIQVMRQGTGASKEAQVQARALQQSATSQVRAFNTLRVEWRADNLQLYQFGQVMNQVGNFGHQLLSIFNTLLLQQIAYGQSTEAAANATLAAQIAQVQYNEAVQTYGQYSQQAFDAQTKMIAADNQAYQAQAQLSLQTQQLYFLYAGVALSLGSFVTTAISAYAQLSVLTTAMAANAAAAGVDAAATGGLGGALLALAAGMGVDVAGLSGITGGFTALGMAATSTEGDVALLSGTFAAAAAAAALIGAGFGSLIAIMGDMTVKGMSAGQAVADVESKLWALNPVLGIIATGVGDLFLLFYDLGSAVRQVGDYLNQGAQDLQNLVPGMNTLKGLLSGITLDTTSWSSSLQNITTVANDVSSAIQTLISWVNQAESAISALQSAISSALGRLGSLGSFKLPFGLSIPGFGTGAIVTKPTLAVVGENGPEAVVPLNGASVTQPPTFSTSGVGQTSTPDITFAPTIDVPVPTLPSMAPPQVVIPPTEPQAAPNVMVPPIEPQPVPNISVEPMAPPIAVKPTAVALPTMQPPERVPLPSGGAKGTTIVNQVTVTAQGSIMSENDLVQLIDSSLYSKYRRVSPS